MVDWMVDWDDIYVRMGHRSRGHVHRAWPKYVPSLADPDISVREKWYFSRWLRRLIGDGAASWRKLVRHGVVEGDPPAWGLPFFIPASKHERGSLC